MKSVSISTTAFLNVYNFKFANHSDFHEISISIVTTSCTLTPIFGRFIRPLEKHYNELCKNLKEHCNCKMLCASKTQKRLRK